MRSFLKIIAGSFLGFILGLFILSLIGIGMIGTAGKAAKVHVDPNSILKLELSSTIPDRAMENPLGNLSMFGFEAGPSLGLFDLKKMIEHAKTDDKIKGIYLTADFQMESYAALDQLRRSLEDFKASGKFIIAYNTFSTQKGYLLTSVADAVYQHPAGVFEFDGIAVETRYYKGLLDKLDIETIPLYAGDYKSASEPYRLTEMSDANRMQLHAIIEDLYDNYLTDISLSRGISKDSLFAWADALAIEDAHAALAHGLVDSLMYEDQVLAALSAKMGYEKEEKLHFVDGVDYKSTIEDSGSKGVREKIAVVYAEGTIVLGEGTEENIGGERFVKLIRKLRKDDKVKAIVLRINSPGGVSISSEDVWRELTLAKQAKPLVTSMGSYAASGGYLFAAPSDMIFAEKNTITGSIGVVGMLLNFTKFFENKLGVTFDRERIGQYADYGNLTREWTEREKQVSQNMVKNIYMDFKEAVAEGRGMTVEEVEAIAQGRVWTGQDAIGIGLVDAIGGLDEALAEAAQRANLEEYRIREYPVQKDFIQQLAEGFMMTKMDKKLRKELGVFYDEYQMLLEMEEWTGIQMRMPFELSID